MNKNKKSIYTALTASLLIFINGLAGLIITRLLIKNYGSDFNGLNSTVSQFINMLMVLEGGFTLATNVALFTPISERNIDLINKIISSTNVIFKKIGVCFLLLGLLSSTIYIFFLQTSIPVFISLMIFYMAVISSAFSLFYATKYRIMIQAEQKEYILNSIQIVTVLLTQIAILVVILSHGNILLVRGATMFGSILNSLLIGYVFKKNYSYLSINVKPDFSLVKGTKDVFIQKMTGMIYTTAPILFISATSGTISASIYMVYNSILSLLKNAVYAFINAPQIGFGQLFVQKEKKYISKIFLQYELIVIIIVSILLTTTSVLIIPFVRIYSFGLTDANYIDPKIALLMILISYFEILHIPSGNMINMSGNFGIGKKIQLLASITLMLTLPSFYFIFGFYGILISVLLVAFELCILEIGYVHMKLFDKIVPHFIRFWVINMICSLVLIFFELWLDLKIDSYVSFFLFGVVLVFFNSIVLLIVNLIVNPVTTKEIIQRLPLSSLRKKI